MDEHYILNVIKAAGLKIDTLEYMNEEYKRTIAALEEENAKLRREKIAKVFNEYSSGGPANE